MLYLAWDREINISLFSCDVFVWKWGPRPRTSSRCYHGNKSAATFKRAFLCIPLSAYLHAKFELGLKIYNRLSRRHWYRIQLRPQKQNFAIEKWISRTCGKLHLKPLLKLVKTWFVFSVDLKISPLSISNLKYLMSAGLCTSSAI